MSKAIIKVLIVEDNELNRDMMEQRLKKKGYDIILAVNGEEAITSAKRFSPHIILMDMGLPVMDGWEATKKLKADPDTKNIPVIALTAHTLASDHQRTVEAGCDDYDTKPVDFVRLIAKIEKLVEKQ